MVNTRATGTRDVPLRLAKLMTEMTNHAYEDGSFLQNVTPITKELLEFWDPKGGFSALRKFNFNDGQWQAILNTIYAHEILKIKTVYDLYTLTDPEL